jgi:hypothetical protein
MLCLPLYGFLRWQCSVTYGIKSYKVAIQTQYERMVPFDFPFLRAVVISVIRMGNGLLILFSQYPGEIRLLGLQKLSRWVQESTHRMDTSKE